MRTLTDAFLRAFGASGGPSEPRVEFEEKNDLSGLEAVLVLAAENGECAWPGVHLEREDLAAELGRVARAARGVDLHEDVVTRIQALHAADFYLACACARGDPAALRAMDATFFPAIDRYVASVDRSAQFADDVRQNMRAELFLRGPARPAKIADYTGRGPLAGWLRVVAVRRALNLRRGGLRANTSPSSRDDEPALDMAASGVDPELDYLKALYRREFREAFVAALGALGPEERNVLRLHHLDGLTLDEAALVTRVSRATVARWLARAREQILSETQRLLRARLQLDSAAMSSVLRLVQSQLDFSIRECLAVPPDEETGSPP